MTPSSSGSLKIAVMACVALLSTASPGHAADANRMVVHYGDLDLTTETGAAVLAQRIRHAAGLLCGAEDGRMLQDLNHYAACRDAVVTATTPKVEIAMAAQHAPAQYASAAGAPTTTLR